MKSKPRWKDDLINELTQCRIKDETPEELSLPYGIPVKKIQRVIEKVNERKRRSE